MLFSWLFPPTFQEPSFLIYVISKRNPILLSHFDIVLQYKNKIIASPLVLCLFFLSAILYQHLSLSLIPCSQILERKMAAKRFFDDSDKDPDEQNEKRIRPNRPSFASYVNL